MILSPSNAHHHSGKKIKLKLKQVQMYFIIHILEPQTIYFLNSVTSSLKAAGGLSDLASAQANPNSILKTVSQTRAPLTAWFGSTH